MTVLDRITKKMKEKKITQRELTEKMNLTEQAFWNWKNDKNKSYMKRLPEIADMLDCTVDSLIKEDVTEDNQIQTLWKAYKTAPDHVQQAIRILLQITGKR